MKNKICSIIVYVEARSIGEIVVGYVMEVTTRSLDSRWQARVRSLTLCTHGIEYIKWDGSQTLLTLMYSRIPILMRGRKSRVTTLMAIIFNSKKLEKKVEELQRALNALTYSSIIDANPKTYYAFSGPSKLTVKEVVEELYKKMELLEKHLGISFEITEAKKSELVLVAKKSK